MYDTVSLVLVKACRTSLAVLWLRLLFQCSGHEFDPRSGNSDPICLRAGWERRLALWPKTWLSFINVALNDKINNNPKTMVTTNISRHLGHGHGKVTLSAR